MIKKIDDIGRIAIPKEIRRSLQIIGGDSFEIIVNSDKSITLKQYKPQFDKQLTSLKEDFLNYATDNSIEVKTETLELFDKLVDNILQYKEG